MTLSLLFALALAIRVALVLIHPSTWAAGGDSEAFVHMAEWLMGRSSTMMVTHPPVYPLFLALTYVLPGFSHPTATLLAQALLGATSVVLLYHLAQALGLHERAAFCAAVWCAIDPFQITFCATLLSETLFITILLAGLLFWVRTFTSGSGRDALAAGLCFAAAALCRSILTPFLPFLTLAFLIPRSTRTRAAALCLLGIALPIAAWSLVLHHRTGQWMMVSAQKGWNSYEGLNEHFDNPVAIEEWQKAMGQEAADRHLDNPLERDRYFWNKTVTFAQEHPLRTAKLMIRKWFKFWRPWLYFPYSKTHSIISALFMIPLYLAALWGIRNGRRLPGGWNAAMIGLVAFVLAYSLLNTITWTQVRYRLPLHPLLAIWAGWGVYSFLYKGKSHA